MRKSVFLLLALAVFQVHGKDVCIGKVTEVLDGDRLVVKCKEKTVKVKLADIETPLAGGNCDAQPYGSHARTYLEKWLLSQKVRLESKQQLPGGFVDGTVFVPGMNTRFDPDKNVSHQMVQEGYALVYKSNDNRLHEFQRSAQKQKIGVWSLPKSCMMEPWKWVKVKNKCEVQGKWKKMRCFL